MTERTHHDVVVLGGGNAGISLGAKLLRSGCRDVAVVDPNDVHHYRPLLSYVGSGMADLDDLRLAQADVMPHGVTWYQDRAVGVDPVARVVRLGDGRELTFGDLAVCPGSEVDWDAVPGSREAMRTAAASTNYLPALAPGTWEAMSGLRSGTAVFTLSEQHVPCPPVALKPLFTAVDHWQREGVLGALDVHLLVEGDRLVPQARADSLLRTAAAEWGVRIRTGVAVDSIDAGAQVLTLRTSGGTEELPYDALHLTPPHRAPSWIAESGLDGPGSDGFVDVDPVTLQHRTYPHVWGVSVVDP